MKKMIFLFVLVFLAASSWASAAPYYRFWRGWKLDPLSSVNFQTGLNSSLIPATVKVGGGKGLIGYLPVMPSQPKPASVPDELALVIYSSESAYQQIRGTPEGKSYGDLHWEFFDQTKGSRSLVPEPYRGKIENEKAYDLLNSDADWKRGHAVFITSKVSGDLKSYIDSLRNHFAKKGLKSHIFLIQGQVIYEYQLWSDRAAFRMNWPLLNKRASSNLILWWGGSSELTKQDWQNPSLEPGMGLNVIF